MFAVKSFFGTGQTILGLLFLDKNKGKTLASNICCGLGGLGPCGTKTIGK